MCRNHDYCKGGFTIIELTISLTVISVLIAAILPFVNDSRNADAEAVTRERIERIEIAIKAYEMEHGDLPCPASFTPGIHEAAYGVALTPVTSPRTECPVPEIQTNRVDQADATSEQRAVFGALPSKTLHLPDEYGFDGWGRRFSYHVSINNVASGSLSPGIIEVVDHTGTVRTDDAAYVVVSHGPNGHGAFTAGGTRRSTLWQSSAAEITNAYVDETGNAIKYTGRVLVAPRRVGTEQSAASAANLSDDVVFTRTQEQIGLNEKGSNLYCWGNHGTLGSGHGKYASTDRAREPVALPSGVKRFTFVGGTCAIGNDGNGYCWGSNANRQLGDGTTNNSSTPVKVVLPAPLIDRSFLEIGKDVAEFACGILDNQTVYCWGDGTSGRMGDGQWTDNNIPTQISLTNIPASERRLSNIVLQSNAVCVHSPIGKPYCWGYNFGSGERARLGIGNKESTNRPDAVILDPTTRLSVHGAFRNLTGVTNNGELMISGYNRYQSSYNPNNVYPMMGAAGPGSESFQPIIIPKPISGPMVKFVGGPTSICALGSNGEIYCSGYRIDGVSAFYGFGYGRSTGSSQGVAGWITPTKPSGVSYYTDMIGNSDGICARADTDDWYCFGQNGNGELGIGNTTQRIFTFQKVLVPPGWSYFTDIYLAQSNWACGIVE